MQVLLLCKLLKISSQQTGKQGYIILRSVQKIKECIIAVKLERNFTKPEIINIYLNTVAFAENVYGIRNASKTFFQKEPDQLTIDEAAVLVGMVNAPSLYNPPPQPQG